VCLLSSVTTHFAGVETEMLQAAITAYEEQQSVFEQSVTPSGAAPQQASMTLMSLVAMAALFAVTLV